MANQAKAIVNDSLSIVGNILTGSVSMAATTTRVLRDGTGKINEGIEAVPSVLGATKDIVTLKTPMIGYIREDQDVEEHVARAAVEEMYDKSVAEVIERGAIEAGALVAMAVEDDEEDAVELSLTEDELKAHLKSQGYVVYKKK